MTVFTSFFECAKALGAKLAIPLPDMSYIKYLTNIIEPLPEKVRREALENSAGRHLRWGYVSGAY